MDLRGVIFENSIFFCFYFHFFRILFFVYYYFENVVLVWLSFFCYKRNLKVNRFFFFQKFKLWIRIRQTSWEKKNNIYNQATRQASGISAAILCLSIQLHCIEWMFGMLPFYVLSISFALITKYFFNTEFGARTDKHRINSISRTMCVHMDE